MTSTILAFDTSGPYCTAALLRDGALLGTVHEDMARGQSERLMILLEDLLTAHAVSWNDLDRIGVGVGPGNFTGIRISVSAARGLALGLGVPAIGVSLFDAFGWQLPRPTAVLLPAPREYVYFQVNSDDCEQSPVLCALDDIDYHCHGPSTTWVGHKADACADKFGGRALAPTLPIAVAIAQITAMRTATGPPSPLYIKPADAAPPRDAPPVILDDA